jgi:hypothetical protein
MMRNLPPSQQNQPALIRPAPDSGRGSRRGISRWLWRAGIGSVLILLLSLGTGWLMFQHIPGWYRPVQIAPERFKEISASFVNNVNRPGVKLHESQEPFEHCFLQDEINAWLAYPEQIWPAAGRWLPANLSDPMVVMDGEGLRVAVTLDERGVRTILSARLTAEVVSDGIRVRLVEVAGGSLPLPKAGVRRLLARIDATAWPAGRYSRDQIGGPPLPALAGLFEGITLPASWRWFNGDAPFRLTALRFEPGIARVTLQPLPRDPSRPQSVTRNRSGHQPVRRRP